MIRQLRSSLQYRFTAGVLCLLFVTIGGLFYLLRVYYNSRLDNALQSYSSYLSRTVEGSFEFATSVHSMEGIQEAATILDRHGGVSRIFLVNRDREIVMSLPDLGVGQRVDPEDPACTVCHLEPAGSRKGSAVVSVDGHDVLRVAVPLRNQPACHSCHGSSPEVRGMVILDYSLDVVKGSLSPSVIGMSSVFVLTVGGLVVAVGFLMNRLTVVRLARLEAAADRIGKGDFGPRVPTAGNDEIDRLTHSFNDMAANLAEFTRRVESDRDFLNQLVNSFKEMIVVFAEGNRVVTANLAAEPLARQLQSPARTDGDREPACPCDPDLVRRAVASTFLTGSASRRVIRSPEKGHLDRILEISTEPLQAERGTVSQVLFVCRDITERSAMEAELVRSERLASLGRLAAGVAHEINNPMASVVTCAEGLLRRVQNDDGRSAGIEGLTEYLEAIRDAAFQTKEISRRLLDLSRRSDGSWSAVDVAEVLRSEIELLLPGGEGAGKRLLLAAGTEPLPVLANRTQLAHAFVNLILNGLDATPAGKSVRVSARRRGTDVVVAIEDEGCGIDDDDLDRVFEPFYTTKPEGVGTGLGLSIAESTFREYGGTIHVASALSVGTCFTVVLPVFEGSEVAARDARGSS